MAHDANAGVGKVHLCQRDHTAHHSWTMPLDTLDRELNEFSIISGIGSPMQRYSASGSLRVGTKPDTLGTRCERTESPTPLTNIGELIA